MDKAVQNVMTFANWNLQQAVRLATLNPARTAGLPSSLGNIVAGAAADIVALSPSGEVRTTIVRGQIA
jgi:N-acetylglucosamine-6-phosphate deacetylase